MTAFTTFGKRRAYRFKKLNKANATARRVNKPVMDALKAPPKKEKTVDGRQNTAITTLSKQVRKLQMSTFGQVQQNRTISIMSHNPNLSQSGFPTQIKPVAFLLQNLNHTQKIYEGRLIPVPGQTYVAAGYADNYNFNVVGQSNNLGLQWNWNHHNRDQNTDIRNGYMPIARYFELRTNITPNNNISLNPLRINIKFVKMRSQQYRTQSTQLAYNLPTTLGAYGNLLVKPTVDNNFTRNYLNKEIHQVVFNKDIYITPLPQNGFETTTANPNSYTTVHRFKYTFPPKFLKTNVDVAAGESADDIWAHLPINDQVWCIISCDGDQAQLDNYRAKMSLTSQNYWRDNIGNEGV